MKISSYVYCWTVLALFAGIASLAFTGIQKSDQTTLVQLRKSQLRSAVMPSGPAPRVMARSRGLVWEDYFEASTAGYRYLGGIQHGPWLVDSVYPASDIILTKAYKPLPFYHQTYGLKNLYINLDRIDQQTPGDFLEAMEAGGLLETDTLVIDFRFLRSVEFGAALRLFNQIAPTRKMALGTIIDPYQDELIMSSGRPFFTVSHTVFILNEKVPDAVRLLIFNLEGQDSYHVAGWPGHVADTVCLMSDYVMGDKTYRVCTQYWTTETGGTVVRPLKVVSEPVRKAMLRSMDELWYKQQDSSGVTELLPSMLKQLLP